MAQAYDTIRNLDPYHLTVGAGFPGNKAQYGDSQLVPDGHAQDSLPMLPSMSCAPGLGTGPCEAPWRGGPLHTVCDKCEERTIPKTGLSLDMVMIENYSPAPEAHAHSDGEALRNGVPWVPMVNCDASYTLEEGSVPHKPPKVLQTNMWMSVIKANTVSQLIFAGGSFTPEIDVPGRPIPNQRGAHPDASIFGSKGSWMLWAQMAQFSAQARVILPSLYAPFGLPQPTVTVVDTDLVIKAPTPRGFPAAHEILIVAKAWRQAADEGWCGHLVVASAAEQSPAIFTLQLGGSFPANTSWASLRAVRLFAADYVVPIDGSGRLTDAIDAAGHNIYQLGDCGDAQPPPPPPPPAVCVVSPPSACYNDTGCKQQADPEAPSSDCVLPVYIGAVHDKVTLEDCANGCWAANKSIAGVDGGNHCRCGEPSDLAVSEAEKLPVSDCAASACSGNSSEKCGSLGRLATYTFECHHAQVKTDDAPSLVPAAPHANALSYFTTWSAQGYVYGANEDLALADYVKNSTSIAHDVLTARYAFSPAEELPGAGWAAFYPKVRADLWFLLDAGWAEEGKGSGANIWMNATKWPFDIPERNSSAPTQRLSRFDAAVRKLGWKGGGLWFGALNDFSKPDAPYTIEEMAGWSKDAGINYWKVDFCADSYVSPCALSRRARAVHPALVFEHGCPTSPFPSFVPFNEGDNGRLDPGMLGHWAIMLNCTDVLRTYDTADALVIPQTLERIQSLLQLAPTLTDRENPSHKVLCAASTPLPIAEGSDMLEGKPPSPPPPVCYPPRDPDLPPQAAAGAPLALECPSGMTMTSILLADFGKALGTCLPALSPEQCVAQSARWCASCPHCEAVR